MSKKKEILDIIYEDEDYIIINKESGMLVIPDRFAKDKENLFTILKEKYGNIFVVHRIDKETSGIICFAKNGKAHKELNKQFEEHSIVKKYLAIVAGFPPQDEGVISIPIMPSQKHAGMVEINRRFGKRSKTKYRVVEKYKMYSLVEAEPVTGRMHQIRVHFMDAGFPLAVDPVYNKNDGIFLSDFKKIYRGKRDEDERPLINRLTLHAKSIEFFHYAKNEKVYFEAELPKDMRSLISQLSKNR